MLKGKRVGDKNPRWKGGKYQTPTGYVLILYRKEHPFKNNQGYIYEHRLVMEQWLRKNEPNHPALIEIDGIKYLRRNWIPHHVNEIRNDNRLENLKVMTLSEHVIFHNKGHHRGGWRLSNETKKKISLSQKGKIKSEEHRRKLSLAHKGKHLSPEHKKKISMIRKGTKLSKETKKKMSLTHKKRWAEMKLR